MVMCIFCFNFQNQSSFQSLTFVDHGSETQLQVTKKMWLAQSSDAQVRLRNLAQQVRISGESDISHLHIYSAQNYPNALSAQCCLWHFAYRLHTVDNPLCHSIRVGYIYSRFWISPSDIDTQIVKSDVQQYTMYLELRCSSCTLPVADYDDYVFVVLFTLDCVMDRLGWVLYYSSLMDILSGSLRTLSTVSSG